MNVNKLALSLLYLLNDKKYYSLEILTKHLNCSRALIVNALELIIYSGINISYVRDLGYCCHDSFIWLNKEVIFQYNSHLSKSFDLITFDVLESTNKFLLNYSKESQDCNDLIPVVTSEIQTNGRGRAGHLWHSGIGSNLAFSLRWRFEQGINALSGLSLVTGLAIVRTLRSLTSLEFNLKWPNDILFDNQKLAGVLIELRGNATGPSVAVIGIGVNFNLHKSFISIIDQKVTDLFLITGTILDRNLVLSELLLQLNTMLTQFQNYGFKFFKNEWMNCHAYHGKNILLINQDGSAVEGIVDGINDDGSICLINDASKSSFHIGEISLRLKPDTQ
jgi:BirA family biotin operon repressor/biotin-[acetyl-CoA-carboxylase] ligase